MRVGWGGVCGVGVGGAHPGVAGEAVSLVGFSARNHPQQVVRDDVDDRRTPPDLLAECAELAGVTAFDLDVAASAENAKAALWYGPSRAPEWAADGLLCPWRLRVWCNPPYSNLGAWVAKAHAESEQCDTIAMLLPANRTEQKWWQELVEPHRLEGTVRVHFLAGRRRFDRPGWTKPAKGDRPPFGLCLVVWP